MKLVKIVLDNLPTDDAIALVIGLEHSLHNNKVNDVLFKEFSTSIENAKNDIIAVVGKQEFVKIYNSIKLLLPAFSTNNSKLN